MEMWGSSGISLGTLPALKASSSFNQAKISLPALPGAVTLALVGYIMHLYSIKTQVMGCIR